MEAINICTKNLKDIYNLRISNVNSGEGNVLRNPLNDLVALKVLYQQSGLYLSNKLYTINALHDLKITDDCFVLPEKLLTIDDEVVGFTMPLINGITLADIIYNADVDIKVKVKYLKKWRYFR